MCWLVLLVCITAGLTACARFTKEGADREVYCILDGKRRGVEELVGTLDIEETTPLADEIRRRGEHELTLRDTLELATVASREYRTQREQVYLAALNLTIELNRYRPLWDGGARGDMLFDEDGIILDGGVDLTLSRAFASGGSVVIGLTQGVLQNLSGNPLNMLQSILSADIVLPLLRGSGETVAQESLRQSERDTMYALRDFALFQQQFTVDIATQYLRALQARDRWTNAEASYESLRRLQEEQVAKEAEDRLALIELDQSKQRLLDADNGRINAHNAFDTSQAVAKSSRSVARGPVLRCAPLHGLRPSNSSETPKGMRIPRSLASSENRCASSSFRGPSFTMSKSVERLSTSVVRRLGNSLASSRMHAMGGKSSALK